MTTDNPAPDLALVGGVVHRFDGEPPAAGLAVTRGRITAVGSDAEIRALVGPATTVVELAGRAVLPGINDSHLHGAWLGAIWPATLMGDGLGPGPSKPLTTPGQRRDAILRAAGLLLPLGITSYTEPGLGPGEDEGETGTFGTSTAQQYRLLAAAGRLPLRVTVLSLFGLIDGPSRIEDFEAGLATLDHSTPDAAFLDFVGVKIFADGIPPMHSAYTSRSYTSGATPQLLVEGTDAADREHNMRRMILAAHRAGLQVAVHATGDRSIDVMLDAVEQARGEYDEDLGHYVIHGDLVTAGQLSRMAELGVGYNTQPGIAPRTAGLVDAALGEGAAVGLWPLQAIVDAGVGLRLSSDAPVLGPDWRTHLAAADAWMGPAADRRARIELLLSCYTVAGAVQDGALGWKGTITPGKVADLAVLAADPFELAPADLPAVEIDLTIVDGTVAYDRAAAPSLR